MLGYVFPPELLNQLFEDASHAGYKKVRLYGGEPLTYKHIDYAVRLCTRHNLIPWVTTNGFLLERKIDTLFKAGLRLVSLGYYGTAEAYNEYVGRKDAYAYLREGVKYTRRQYGDDVRLKIEFLLMQPTCNREALYDVVAFAEEFNIPITVNLVHYSLPYFKDCKEKSLQFTEVDRGRIESFTLDLLKTMKRKPHLINRSKEGLASISDWLIQKENMKVPCDRDSMLWIGPDGSVQLCYVTFPLGNLNNKRLREMVHTPVHRDAVRNCRALNCPNCHCGYSSRIDKHRKSRRHYMRVYKRRYSDQGATYGDPVP